MVLLAGNKVDLAPNPLTPSRNSLFFRVSWKQGERMARSLSSKPNTNTNSHSNSHSDSTSDSKGRGGEEGEGEGVKCEFVGHISAKDSVDVEEVVAKAVRRLRRNREVERARESTRRMLRAEAARRRIEEVACETERTWRGRWGQCCIM